MDSEFETIQSKLDELDTKNRLKILVKLIPLLIPKQQKMDQVVTNDPEKQAHSRPIIISVDGIPKCMRDQSGKVIS